MIPADLQTALQAFDEAALTMLANKGLVRRAQRDFEEGKIALASVDGSAAIVTADGETVRIDAKGPRTATCTCPALGICRHRLGAVLFLQAAAPYAESGVAALPPQAEEAPDFAGEIAALTPSILMKWAGKASWRAAAELSDGQDVRVSIEGRALLIHLGEEGDQIRFLSGQGLDGMVSKLAPALRKAHHAAAIRLARRHFGIIDTEEEVAASSPIASESQGDDGLDLAFLNNVSEALYECANVALNIAPLSLEERLFTLSVSSRADALPRLGAMLRTLSRALRQRRTRDFAFDPDVCLALMSDCFALIAALKHTQESRQQDRLDVLKGRARQEYVGVGTLALMGCGADHWQTTAGARGITGHFYSREQDAWFSASVARAAGQDPSFDPLNAYKYETLWRSSALEKLARTSLNLREASASETGRLSSGQAVSASVNNDQSVADHVNWPCRLENWEELANRLEARLLGDIGKPARLQEPVIISPRRISRPRFDDLAQTLTWAVEDKDGAWLSLSLEHGRHKGAVLDALEKIADAGWTGSIVALASIDGPKFRLAPFALIEKDKLFCLGLDAMPTPPKPTLGALTSRFVADLRERLGNLPREFITAPTPVTMRLLADCWQHMVEMAEIGISLNRTQFETGLARLVRRLDDAGLVGLGQVLNGVIAESKIAPNAYYKACCALTLARRQMIGLPYVIPIA
jgi:hypothetical protein